MNPQKIIFIAGPTAVGKSDVALKLAKKYDGEIISADSMQVYKEINIASNKSSSEEFKCISHHLVNIISIEEEFNVAQFNVLAKETIKDIHQRNHIPIIVGGSGLYLQVLLDGIFEGEPKDEEFRKSLYQFVEEKGQQELYERLKKEDPLSAEKIHPNNIKKVIRALEVCQKEDQPISIIQKKREGIWGKYDIKLFMLNQDRQILYDKINKRVEKMFVDGLVEEVEKLKDSSWSLTAKGLIGVKEILGYLKGEYDLDRAKELMQRNTRRFAKRQLTWFRKEIRFEWIDIKDNEGVEFIVNRIEGRL